MSKKIATHDFSWALKQLKAGRTVRRGQWEPIPCGESLGVCIVDFVALVPREDKAKITKTQRPHFSKMSKDALVETHLVRGTILGMWIPGWLPSVEDLLAEDWVHSEV